MGDITSEFEKNERQRSSLIREIAQRQLKGAVVVNAAKLSRVPIPRTLLRYWHDPYGIPEDVQACLESWDRLSDEGFELLLFNDETASRYIDANYGSNEQKAFDRCVHPAMRSDYFRMCFLLIEGGFYVDTDDVLVDDSWSVLFENNSLKLQPLCYDITANAMGRSSDIWDERAPTSERIFYVNNDPIVTPPNHPLLRKSLHNSTAKLLTDSWHPEIQSTTGPGNLTAALAAHVTEQWQSDKTADVELIKDWDTIAEMRWELSYRNDERNWRNVYGY